MIKYIKKKIAILSLAFSNVEKGMLNNSGASMNSDIRKHQRLNQGRLSDALINGEVTEAVSELRWRTYKVLDRTANLTATIVGYDEDGIPIVETTTKTSDLKKLKVDDTDPYKPIMVIKNEPIITSTTDIMNSLNIGEDNIEIDSNTIDSKNETEFPIDVEREDITALEIEKYSKKMVIRDMGGDGEYLLEFYIPLYPDEYNRKSNFIIAEIKKIMKSPIFSNLTNIQKVKFITNKSIGIKDNQYFEYDIKSFHNIVVFNGFYVVKFKAKVIKNGVDVTLIHINEALEKKYENKEKK